MGRRGGVHISKEERVLPFWCYRQTNSGGSFYFSKSGGIGVYVVVEADSATDADRRAEDIDLYFNGCESDRDCRCCGDRWYPASGEGDSVPSVYNVPVEDFGSHWPQLGEQSGEPPHIFVHYKDGRIESFDMKKQTREQNAAMWAKRSKVKKEIE